MSIAYLCDRALGCTFIVWHGDVTPAEWHAHADRMFEDPAFPPGRNILADFRSARGAPSITEDTMRQIGDRWTAKARRLPQMRAALVPNGSWDKAQRVVQQEIVSTTVRFIL